ncbi:DUF5348 domain-containing protein [Alicyclobacillus sp. SO9]|uniref:DUF5348 domain-containing protein n=1 Tax=Alicyclobacillus sp. SO9 TaxID=2665646 RepID=UPI0018E79C35|nr:DUF5348 domain-containing protein [Alicyclobacillus sp. SO9]QQE77836.1 DUF5348 domain-containing protein [Alicyclobacillus sp. SO9]
MTWCKGFIAYDEELGRWVFEGEDAWYSLRCGETLKLHFPNRTMTGRLELSQKWYVILENVPLGLLERRRYKVTIEI